MASLSRPYATKLLQALLTGAAIPNTGMYLALYTGATGLLDGVGTQEVAASSYQRVAVSFTAPLNAQSKNEYLVSFPTATADWGTITHLAVVDAASGGTVVSFAALPTPQAIPSGYTCKVDANSITFTAQ